MAFEKDVVGMNIIATGLNDRNVEEFLSVLEQRIDHIIQVIHKWDVTSKIERLHLLEHEMIGLVQHVYYF